MILIREKDHRNHKMAPKLRRTEKIERSLNLKLTEVGKRGNSGEKTAKRDVV